MEGINIEHQTFYGTFSFTGYLSPYIQNRPNLTITQTDSTRPGFFKPVQIVKEIKSESSNKVVHNNGSIEQLPKPQSLAAAAYGLPAYSAPQDSQPNRRGPSHSDYVTTSAGFVPSPRSVSSEPTVYDMSGSSNINSYRARPANEGQRSAYSPLDSSSSQSSGGSDELDAYMRAAASESSSHGSTTSGHDSSHGSSYPNYDHSRPSSTSSSQSSSSQSQSISRRKPSSSYGDEPFDPSSAKHFMKTHVVRDNNDHGTSSYSDHSSNGHHMIGSATNDNELAHLAASMSEFQSSPSGDFASFGSDPSFGSDSIPSFSDSNVFASGSNFNPQLAPSSQLMGAHSFPNSIASVVPGKKLK